MESFLFYAFSAVVVIGSLAMVISRNMVHSALYMVAAFLGFCRLVDTGCWSECAGVSLSQSGLQ